VDARTLDLTRLFSHPVQYVVPLFQRPYVWDQQSQWEPLWDDIRLVAEGFMGSPNGSDGSDVAPHFLGAIVLEQAPNATGSVEHRSVIDGQQRLTTLQIFVGAVLEVAMIQEADQESGALRSLIFNADHAVEDYRDRFKVWPTNRDRTAFAAVLQPSDDPEAGMNATEGHRLAHAEHYFRAVVSEWVEDEAGEGTPSDRLKALRTVVSRLLKVVVIDLGDEDNPQVIFETLNARGTPLLAADLVKNLIFHRAEHAGLNVEQLYEEQWSPFDQDEWRQEIRQGRLTRPRVEVFLNHWLTMQTEREVGSRSLFQSFRQFVDHGDVPVDQVLAGFASDGRVFNSFGEFEDGSREQLFFSRVEVLDVTTLFPVLLWLFRQEESVLSRERRLRACKMLESWLVRRTVSRLTTKGYNRYFLELLRPLKQAPERADEIILDELRSETADATFWPSDARIEEAFVEGARYCSITQSRVRMLIEGFEIELRKRVNLGEGLPVEGTLTIEHVLPQSWQENWALSEGSGEEAAVERDSAVHRMGNLTLVTNKLNPSMSNSQWEMKKAALEEHSVLMLNRGVLRGDPTSWNEESIDARGRELSELALEIWPGPDAAAWTEAAGTPTTAT
jgi:hypothetical protein